jgi:hypothetical protein
MPLATMSNCDASELTRDELEFTGIDYARENLFIMKDKNEWKIESFLWF